MFLAHYLPVSRLALGGGESWESGGKGKNHLGQSYVDCVVGRGGGLSSLSGPCVAPPWYHEPPHFHPFERRRNHLGLPIPARRPQDISAPAMRHFTPQHWLLCHMGLYQFEFEFTCFSTFWHRGRLINRKCTWSCGGVVASATSYAADANADNIREN